MAKATKKVAGDEAGTDVVDTNAATASVTVATKPADDAAPVTALPADAVNALGGTLIRSDKVDLLELNKAAMKARSNIDLIREQAKKAAADAVDKVLQGNL